MTYDPHAVYLMRNEWSEANFKIGISNRPFRRHLEVDDQYGVSSRIITTCWFPNRHFAGKAELIWHKRYNELQTDDHGGREWFSLGKTQIDEFCAWAELSMPGDALKQWLFRDGASYKEVKAFVSQLFNGIPKRHYHPSIDVWIRNGLSASSS